jgi:ATP/ADP translocase
MCIICVSYVLCPQVFARASKYSLFDPAKEMVYIEMDADEKKQGKAAVDLVGSQVRAYRIQSIDRRSGYGVQGVGVS